MVNVAIVVLNWNNYKDTIHCLTSLYQLECPEETNFKVFVCDNGSTDDSIGHIKKWAKGVSHLCGVKVINTSSGLGLDRRKMSIELIIFKNDDNKGYAAGNNSAIRYILKNWEMDYIWILNNDIEAAPDSLCHLIRSTRENPAVGIWGTTIIDYYNRNLIQCAGGALYHPFLTYSRNYLFKKHVNDICKVDKKIIHFDYISGASMFIKKSLFDEIGLFSEDFFLYFEEIDFSNRCKSKNYTLGWSMNSIIYHKEGGTLGSNRQINKKSQRSEYYSNLSLLIYSRKYYKPLLPFIMINRFVLKSFYFLLRGKISFFKPLIQAYSDFMRCI